MILIDALYLVSDGGLVLLKYFLQELEKKKGDFILLIDKRHKGLVNHERFKYTKMSSSEVNRAFFYRENRAKISAVFCLANVPPPIKITVPVHIYFHNYLIVDTTDSNLNLRQKSILWAKRKYIQLKNRKSYNWHVQTLLIKQRLNKKLKVSTDSISLTPFFPSIKREKKSQTSPLSNSFIYVAASSPHKNHNNLIQGFLDAAQLSDDKIYLHLTLDKNTVDSFLFCKKEVPPNLEIIPLGLLSHSLLIKKYLENEYLIYPSLKESFGLPLIEATQLGLKIIAADLPYTFEVVRPSLIFDPLSIESIRNIVINAIHLVNVEPSKLRIDNKINELIHTIFKDV